MRFGLLLLAFLTSPLFFAASAETDIQALLDKQVADWNRGDISSFVQSYAQECIFVGREKVVEGRAGVESRYRQNYSTPEAMGRLTYTDLKIRKIDNRVTVVTGAFHLQRSGAGGGDKSGIFSLVLERQGAVWRIVLDHTS